MLLIFTVFCPYRFLFIITVYVRSAVPRGQYEYGPGHYTPPTPLKFDPIFKPKTVNTLLAVVLIEFYTRSFYVRVTIIIIVRE